MIPTRLGESQKQILEHLKRHGSGTIPELAAEVGLSVETVRTHLRSLGSEGLVERRGRRRSGPGRPEIVYGLTDAADGLFPSQEGQLLRELAAFLEGGGHDELVRDFFDRQAGRRWSAARDRLQGLEGPARIEEVARILTDEGFMAEVDTDPEGRKLLRLCHCPMRSLVDVTQAPCRSELRSVRKMLGQRLVRVTYIPAGDASCCYAMKEAG